LILGAGASIDYGFPSGQQLLDEIVDFLDGAGLDHSIKNRIYLSMLLGNYKKETREQTDLKVCYQTVVNFYDTLVNVSPASIDDFIFMMSNKSNNDFVFLAKALIVICISKYENENQAFTTFIDRNVSPSIKRLKRAWYSYLWKVIYSDCEKKSDLELSLKNLIIINFNYDRSLEFFLGTRIKSAFNLNEIELNKILNENLFAHHVYGKLGNLFLENQVNPGIAIKNEYKSLLIDRSQIETTGNQINDINFELDRLQLFLSIDATLEREKLIFNLKTIMHLTSKIFTYTQSLKEYQPKIEIIKEKLTGLSRVFFLGFSYQPQNLDWLKTNVFSEIVTTNVWGTSYGFGRAAYLNLVDDINNLYQEQNIQRRTLEGFQKYENCVPNSIPYVQAKNSQKDYLDRGYHQLKISDFFNEVQSLG